jgi:two-component system CheB/CheR fusion protein
MMNLIDNSVKYSRDNKEIIVDAKTENGYAIVSVKDFGIGMSPADQMKIFERFYRAEDNSMLASGLGIGLYISSEIIREHKGRMTVESKLNEGSILSFSIPLVSKG